MNDIQLLLDARSKDLDTTRYSVKLHGGEGYMLSVVGDDAATDENRMAAMIPFADGNRRDGCGDLLEVGGIDTSRHRKNPIVLFDHAREYKLPVALAEDPDTGEYTCFIDLVAKTAKDLCFFYRGTGMKGVEKTKEYDHAQFCEQLFHLWAKKYLRAGSIGYLIKAARELPPDYEAGTPKGAHLLGVMKLETSVVVLPMNADTVKMVLAMPKVCDKPLSPYLVKSLTPFAPVETKVFTGYTTKDVSKGVEARGNTTTESLFRVGEKLANNQLPAPMPGYGQIFYNGDHVWYVGGDGDDDGFEKLARETLSNVPGVNKVTCEAEGFPPKNEGWVQVYPKKEHVKSLPANTVIEPVPHDDTNPGANNPPPQSRQSFLDTGQPIAATKQLRKKYRVKQWPEGTAREDDHKSLEMEGENKSMSEETPAAEHEEADAATPEPDEPYSAQVLRHLHTDGLDRMQHYDSMLPMLEHPEVKKHLVRLAQAVEKELTEREGLWDKHHKPSGLKDLEGRIPEEEEGEEEIEEGEGEKEEGEEEVAEGEEKEEEGEEEVAEAVEGKSLNGYQVKSLRLKYRMKSLCPECGSDPCACDDEDAPGNEDHQEHDDEDVDPAGDTDLGHEEDQEGPGDEEEGVAEDTDLGDEEDQEPPGRPTGSVAHLLHPDHKKSIMEAKGFFDELANAHVGGFLDDQTRLDAYHFGKTLSGIKDMLGGLLGGGGGGEGEKDDEEMDEEGKSLGGEEKAFDFAKHPHGQALGEASAFLDFMARETNPWGGQEAFDFGAKCASCGKSLQDLIEGDADTDEAGDEEETEREHDDGEEAPEEVAGFDEDELDAKSLATQPKKLTPKTKGDPGCKTKTLQPKPEQRTKTRPQKPAPAKGNNRLRKVFESQKKVLDAQGEDLAKIGKQLERLTKFVRP